MAGCTNRQHPWRIPGRCHTAVLDETARSVAVVAGRSDHDDPRLDRLEGRKRQRIDVVRFVHAGRDRKVAHSSLERGFVRNDIVQRRDDVADEPVTGAVEHLVHAETRPRCDAGPGAPGIEPVAGDDARDVRAMPVIVVGRRQSADEIDEPVHALRPGRVIQIVMLCRHT